MEGGGGILGPGLPLPSSFTGLMPRGLTAREESDPTGRAGPGLREPTAGSGCKAPPLLGAQPSKGSHISPSPSAALGHPVRGPAAEGLTGSSWWGRQAPLSPAGLSPWQEQQDCRSACPSRHHRNHTRDFAQAEPHLPRGIFSHLALRRHTLQTPALEAPGAPSLLPCAEQVLGNRGWTLGPLCPVAFTLARRPRVTPGWTCAHMLALPRWLTLSVLSKALWPQPWAAEWGRVRTKVIWVPQEAGAGCLQGLPVSPPGMHQDPSPCPPPGGGMWQRLLGARSLGGGW
nr:uncharacterized protein LOC116284350 [Vicugna pacos]